MRTRRVLTPLLALAAITPVAAALPGNSIVLAILGIGSLIFIHEWGHFAACRLTGTRTETFSIGFGPRLFGWEKDRDGKRRFTVGARQLDPDDHAMDFRVAAVPLGGYVKMAGELPGEPGTGAADEFPQKTASQRAFIISAGVIMNVLTALVFYGVAYGFGRASPPPVVGLVTPGGPAWEAGLTAGDRVVSVSGESVETNVDLLIESAVASRGERSTVVVQRDGGQHVPIEIQARHDDDEGRMRMGFALGFGLTVGHGDDALVLAADTPATVEGLPVRGGLEAWTRIQALLRADRLPVRVALADGRAVDLAPTRGAEAAPDADAAPVQVGLEPLHVVRVAAVRAAAVGVLQVGDLLKAPVDGQGTPLEEPGSATGWELDALADVAWTGLVVERDGAPQTLAVSLPTAAARMALLAQVHLEDEDVGAVRAARRPGLVPGENDGWYRSAPSTLAAAGLQPGDRLRQLGRREVTTWAEITKALQTLAAGETIEAVVVGDDEVRRTLVLTGRPAEFVGHLALTLEDGRESLQRDGLAAVVGAGAGRTWREIRNVFRTIGAFVTGRVSFRKNVAGPLTIVKVSSDLADRGFLELLWFLAYVSVMLAVLNILPIPVLDGGHLLFILIEKIKGSPLKDETMFRFQKVGMVLLLVLMVFAFWNDIDRVILGR